MFFCNLYCRLEPERPPDLKECFNIPEIKSVRKFLVLVLNFLFCLLPCQFCVPEIEAFQDTFRNLYEALLEIAKELLRLMGQSLLKVVANYMYNLIRELLNKNVEPPKNVTLRIGQIFFCSQTDEQTELPMSHVAFNLSLVRTMAMLHGKWFHVSIVSL